jgi:hypothetical protein
LDFKKKGEIMLKLNEYELFELDKFNKKSKCRKGGQIVLYLLTEKSRLSYIKAHYLNGATIKIAGKDYEFADYFSHHHRPVAQCDEQTLKEIIKALQQLDEKMITARSRADWSLCEQLNKERVFLKRYLKESLRTNGQIRHFRTVVYEMKKQVVRAVRRFLDDLEKWSPELGAKLRGNLVFKDSYLELGLLGTASLGFLGKA